MLTDLKIKGLKPEQKKKRYSDRDGLYLEVRSSGNKVFIFRFQWNKKPQTITIGRYPSISLAEARNIATTYRDSINNGIDPRTKDEEAEKKTTFKDIAALWYTKNSPSWRERTKTLHTRALTKDIYPILGDMPIDEITKASILQVITSKEELGHHELAHRLHDRMKAIFDFALVAGLTDNYPFLGLKKALAPKPKTKNQPAVSPNEAHEMLAKIKNCKASKIVKLYVEILSHLFVRPSELRLAKWDEFDLQQTEWHIPTDRMKMDAPHWVPLSPQVIAILKELRLIAGFTPFLFASQSSKIPQPISETSARKLLHKIGYKDRHTLHGFRSLASTVLHERSTFRTDAIEVQLTHKVRGVKGVYLRADFKEERRRMMSWYSEWLFNSNTSPQFNYIVS